MLNIGAGEIAIILVVALLVLGPNRLPEMARVIGKFVREFRKQTDDVRVMVEREFYKIEEDLNEGLDPRLKPEEGPTPSGEKPAAPELPEKTTAPVPQTVARNLVRAPEPVQAPAAAEEEKPQ